MMANLRLPWQSRNNNFQTNEQKIMNNPLVPYIKTQLSRGMPKNLIFENLMKQGYPYRNIKITFSALEKANTSQLDWRSPTSINETARMIRRDIRAKRISYSMGMRILLQARDNLRTMTTNLRDRRLWQIAKEIKITKKLLMQRYGDPLIVNQYQVIGKRV